ncbi:tripartite tricarboxylate transporter substrate binding protein [Roseococcus sp. SDR]|uniref:Bug family tripartite tricarboxylate transporter substrate binding protein n=1 Tax=Roseococcus sp. SDR TaxID=2835532 RepID=UPI001BCF4538|nr:tripartite tricarboxylate transporter substrate binding protein [Roseococcus sp. SDR]MBS7792439.1 tripartite tricarboxylate transporter substrate binding protein [Roseococcus sp. SDR]MBV1847753.1 tripartite tricarboxylate transporter substrate binding protein [Roseococcus sp. SDR]
MPKLSRRAAGLALLATPALAQAQSWAPSQPVRVIIPFTPGGTMDTVVRPVQQILQQELGQPIIMEHRPGAATVIGTQEVMRAPADGHTMIMIANSFAANITLRPSMPYNSLRDFAPLAMATVVPHVLVVHPSVARDFPAFIAAGRRAGANLAFGSYGIGTSNHLGGEQFRELTGIGATHVPYNGAPQAYTDLIGGRLQFMFANLPDVIQPAQAGQMRPIAISAERRVRELPDVPTMAELGFPLVLSDSWFGLITRADVPAPARARLEAAWLAALTRPEVKGRLEELGFTVLAKPGAEFGTEIRRYADTYAQVIRANNIRVE